jgi:hypothetical protein
MEARSTQRILPVTQQERKTTLPQTPKTIPTVMLRLTRMHQVDQHRIACEGCSPMGAHEITMVLACFFTGASRVCSCNITNNWRIGWSISRHRISHCLTIQRCIPKTSGGIKEDIGKKCQLRTEPDTGIGMKGGEGKK